MHGTVIHSNLWKLPLSYTGRFAMQAIKKVNFNAIPKVIPKIPVSLGICLLRLFNTWFRPYIILVYWPCTGLTRFQSPLIRNQWKSIIGKLIDQSKPINVNRWSIDSHTNMPATYIDFHQLLLITCPFPFNNWWKSMKSHRMLSHLLLIDLQYQSINCYWLISIGIDFDRLTNSSVTM